jgi:hypothetical protein
MAIFQHGQNMRWTDFVDRFIHASDSDGLDNLHTSIHKRNYLNILGSLRLKNEYLNQNPDFSMINLKHYYIHLLEQFRRCCILLEFTSEHLGEIRIGWNMECYKKRGLQL